MKIYKNKRRLLRVLLQALLEWWLLLGTTIAGLAVVGPDTNFALALSTATPMPSSTGHDPTRIRSRCHCGSLELLIDVWGSQSSRNPSAKKEETNNDDNDTHRDRAINCHCQSCRRYHTGAFATFLETDSSNICVQKGRDKIGKYVSSDCKELGPVERWFCTDCSSKLLTVPALQPQQQQQDSVSTSSSSSSLEGKTDASTSDATGDATSGSDSGDDQENGTITIDQTTRIQDLLPAAATKTTTTKCVCLLNLGPVVEDGISPGVTNSWKEQLERPENNVHSDNNTSALWARALPDYDYEDGNDYDYEDDDEDDDSDEDDDDDNDEHDSEDDDDDDDYCDDEALPSPLKWSGGCACGACRYEFDLTHPTELQHCYCHLCRELSGSPFMTWIPVEKQDFRWMVRGRTGGGGEKETPTALSPSLSSSSSSPLQFVRTTPFGSRHICRNCQSVMTIVYDEQPDHVWPCAGSLDDSALPRDAAKMGKCLSRVCHICCGYHPTWLRTRDDGMERMEEAC